MKNTNVDIQILSTVPVMFNYWAHPYHTLDLCNLLNDDIANQIRLNRSENEQIGGNQSFYGFGTVPMQDPQLAVEEMTRCVKDLDFKGIQIGTHINDWNLDEKKLYPIWKRAEELECPIFVHPWDMEHICRSTKYWLPWLVGMPTETTTASMFLYIKYDILKYVLLNFY